MRESNNEKTNYDNIDCSDCMQHYIYKSITNSINADYQNSKEYGVVIKCSLLKKLDKRHILLHKK